MRTILSKGMRTFQDMITEPKKLNSKKIKINHKSQFESTPKGNSKAKDQNDLIGEKARRKAEEKKIVLQKYNRCRIQAQKQISTQ